MEQIFAGALKLLKTAPNGADAVTMKIGGGPAEPIVPRIDRLMIPILASSRGSKLLRRSEMRPSIDLRAYIDQTEPGKYGVGVERITGMAAFSTMIDPSEPVGGCVAETPEAAVEGLRQILSQFTDRGINLELMSLAYRTDKFAEREFSPDREAAARNQPRRWRDLLSALVDAELANFANEVVAKAFAWGDGSAAAENLSLWFYANGDYKTVYFTINPNDDGTFGLSIKDHICWPWKEKEKTLRTEQEVQAAIAKHLVATHGFKLKSLKVYFNHGQRLAA